MTNWRDRGEVGLVQYGSMRMGAYCVEMHTGGDIGPARHLFLLHHSRGRGRFAMRHQRPAMTVQFIGLYVVDRIIRIALHVGSASSCH